MPDRLDDADSILFQWARWSRFGTPGPKTQRVSATGRALTVLKGGAARAFAEIDRDELVLIDQIVARMHPQHRGAIESCYIHKIPVDTKGRSQVLKKSHKMFMKLYEEARMEQTRASGARLANDAQQVREVRGAQDTQWRSR